AIAARNQAPMFSFVQRRLAPEGLRLYFVRVPEAQEHFDGASRLPTWALAAVLLGLSLVAALQTYRSGGADERIRFARRSEQALETINFRMAAYVNVLTEARGLFTAVGLPDREGFARFVANMDLTA